jgi:hypothetical protein
LDECSGLTGDEQTACRLALFDRFHDKFKEVDCDDAFPNNIIERNICKALVSGDINKCVNLEPNQKEVDLCKGYMIDKQCADISDLAEREECYYNKALQNGCTTACSEIDDPDKRNLCLAKVTGDKKYCESIKSDEVKNQCLGINPSQTAETSPLDLKKYKGCRVEVYWKRPNITGDVAIYCVATGDFSGDQFKGKGDWDSSWQTDEYHGNGTITAVITASSKDIKDSKVANLTAHWTRVFNNFSNDVDEYTLTIQDIPYTDSTDKAVVVWYSLGVGPHGATIPEPRLQNALVSLTCKSTTTRHGQRISTTINDFALTRCEVIFGSGNP